MFSGSSQHWILDVYIIKEHFLSNLDGIILAPVKNRRQSLCSVVCALTWEAAARNHKETNACREREHKLKWTRTVIPTTWSDHTRFREKTYFQVRFWHTNYPQACFLLVGHTHLKLTGKVMCAYTSEVAAWTVMSSQSPPRSGMVIPRAWRVCIFTYHLLYLASWSSLLQRRSNRRKYSPLQTCYCLILQKQALGTQP